MTSQPFVSVIVPAFNEEKYLRICLEAVRAQNYPRERIEILVVDNGSSDRTVAIAEELADSVFVLPKKTVSAVRNHGASRAKGEIVAFLDADCAPVPDWLQAAGSRLSQENCVTGSRYSNPPDSTWVTRCWFAEPRSAPVRVHALSGGNIVLHKKLFDSLGGFDEALKTGEDAEFCARAGAVAPIVDDPAVKVYHYGVPRTVREFFRREIWLGLGAFGTFRLNVWDKPLLGTVAFLGLFCLLAAGLLIWILGGSLTLLLSAFFLLSALLLVTVLYRRRELRDALHAVQMCTLYVLFYSGRSISLVLLLLGGNYYHHNKKQ